MKAFIIDPVAQTITAAEREHWSVADMREVIFPDGRDNCCGHMTLNTGDCVWVDDDGWATEGLRIFRIDGYDWPLAGIGLVIGLDGPEQADVKANLEWLQAVVRWTDEETTGDMLPGLQRGNHVVISQGPVLRRVA